MIGTVFDDADSDSKLESEGVRKGKTISCLTGKPVSSSFEDFDISGKLGDANFSMGFRAPPQADDERIFRLACYQLQEFHYFLTYDHAERQGFSWRGSIAPLDAVRMWPIRPSLRSR